MKKIINLKEKKEIELNDNIIEIDELMCPIILCLLKKGYNTKFCCSGHDDPQEFLIVKATIDSYEKISSSPDYAILDVKTDYFWYGTPALGRNIYITFADDYDFETIPEGFRFTEKNLSKALLYYETAEDIDNFNRKTKEEINKEIIDANDLLLRWAESLPINKF